MIFSQRFSYGIERLPDIYAHHQIPECIVISRIDGGMLDLSRKEEEVVVDAICGAAVLRGSDVYAPGVLAMSPSMSIVSQVYKSEFSNRHFSFILSEIFTQPYSRSEPTSQHKRAMVSFASNLR